MLSIIQAHWPPVLHVEHVEGAELWSGRGWVCYGDIRVHKVSRTWTCLSTVHLLSDGMHKKDDWNMWLDLSFVNTTNFLISVKSISDSYQNVVYISNWWYWYTCISSSCHLIFSKISCGISKFTEWAMKEELSKYPRVRTFLISWGQEMHIKHYYVDLSSWSEFWFAKICIDMNILALLPASNILETVLIANKKIQHRPGESSFLLKYNNSMNWEEFYNRCVFVTVKCSYFQMSSELFCIDMHLYSQISSLVLHFPFLELFLPVYAKWGSETSDLCLTMLCNPL